MTTYTLQVASSGYVLASGFPFRSLAVIHALEHFPEDFMRTEVVPVALDPDVLTDRASDLLLDDRPWRIGYRTCPGCDRAVHHSDLFSHARECTALRTLGGSR